MLLPPIINFAVNNRLQYYAGVFHSQFLPVIKLAQRVNLRISSIHNHKVLSNSTIYDLCKAFKDATYYSENSRNLYYYLYLLRLVFAEEGFNTLSII